MRFLSSLLLLALAVPAAGQEREIRRANLPLRVERELLRMFDGGAARYEGPVTVDPGEVIRGDVAVTGGPFRVEGRVDGDLAVVGGDVELASGGAVTGRVVVVGGEVRMADGAEVGGTITAYGTGWGRWADRRDGEEDDDWRDRRRRDRWDDGYSRLTLRVGSGYNRVEGLPVAFGPVIQTGGSTPLRVEALAVWRSEAGASLDTDRMGYEVTVEQSFTRDRAFGIGGSVFSIVDPMDRWQISDLEASLAAAFFHDDYRDYYDRTGWSVFARAEPVRGVEARVEFRDERQETVPAGDPWSLFDGGDRWRLQPLVAEGDLQTVTGSLELDRRDDRKDPARGWYARMAVSRPVGGELVRPMLFDVSPSVELDGPGGVLPAHEVDTDFTVGEVDLRRYAPVGWDGQLAVRLVGGGVLTETALPPQYQHALGGIGTLPGYDLFHGDCGARSFAGGLGVSEYYPSYGCDRFALAQVEYRGELSFGFEIGDPDWDDDDWWDVVEIDFSPTWVVFMDAGRGWAYGDPALGGDRDTGTLVDAGVGIALDELGFYAALPLNGDVDQEPRFLIRLGRRF
jgi:hypothetical protein